ncbi:MAG: hypothetical protein ACHQX3_11470 [Nitrospirales bacterium]
MAEWKGGSTSFVHYELGFILNGLTTIVWEGDKFPPLGMHDTLYRIVKAIRVAYPDAQVEGFHLCNGRSYSY